MSKKRECVNCGCKFIRWGPSSRDPGLPVSEDVKVKLDTFLKSYDESSEYYQFLDSLCDECLYYTMWHKQKKEKEEQEEREIEEREERFHRNPSFDDDDDEYNEWPGLDRCDYRGG